MKYLWNYILVFSFMVVGCDHYSNVLANKHEITIDTREGFIGCDVNISVEEFNYMYTLTVTIKNNSCIVVSLHQINVIWVNDHGKSYTGNASQYANVVLDHQFCEPTQHEKLPIKLNPAQDVTFFIDFTESSRPLLNNNNSSTKPYSYISFMLEINGCIYDKKIPFDGRMDGSELPILF